MNALAETEAPAAYRAHGPAKKKSFIRWSAGNAASDTDEFLTEITIHKDAFYRFVKRTVWDPEDVDDVFSSAVLAAYENRHKYTTGTNFRAWMFRILLNKCFIANRETSRHPVPLDDVIEVCNVSVSASRTVDVLDEPMKILDECGDEVYRAFRKLSTAQRACIMLRGIERYSYREIADVLDIPLGTVVTHLARGRAKLRTELWEYASKRGIVRSAQGF